MPEKINIIYLYQHKYSDPVSAFPSKESTEAYDNATPEFMQRAEQESNETKRNEENKMRATVACGMVRLKSVAGLLRGSRLKKNEGLKAEKKIPYGSLHYSWRYVTSDLQWALSKPYQLWHEIGIW